MNKSSLISLCIIAMSVIGCTQPDEPAAKQNVNGSSATTPKATMKETNTTEMEKTTTEYVEKGKEVVVEKTNEVVDAVKEKSIELKDNTKDKATELMKKNNLPN